MWLLFTARQGKGFLGGSVSKEPACNVGDLGSIPGLGRFPGEGHGIPIQYSHLENPMDRGAWWATVHGGPKELDMTEQLSKGKVLKILEDRIIALHCY